MHSNVLPDKGLGTPCAMDDGRILYPSSKGFISFNTEDMKTNPYPPIVHIENISYTDPGSSAVRFDTLSTLRLKQAELGYRQNSVTFNFVALHYANPTENRYAYRLEGYSKNWTYTKTQRSVTFNNLNPGIYTFRVKAANSDGVWNEKGDSFTLIIASPWWSRWWAWFIYIVGFAGFVGLIVRYQARKLLQDNLVLEQKVKERTDEVIRQKLEIEQTLTELKTTQSQLIQSEKMASLGELTAGIAHEIQNPLNFVNNFSDVSRELIGELKEELTAGHTEDVLAIADDLTQNLEKIYHHGKRADGIVKGMLEHSRASTGRKEPTDLNKLADEYLRLAYHGLRAKDKTFNAELVTDFDGQISAINVIPQDIGRVLLNIFNNAFYATQQQAKLTNEFYKPAVTVSTALKDGAVEISIHDNGTGMSDQVREKMMQPFFTTKPTGEGTGLGLSLSYDIIVKGHGGTIAVSSAIGQGTTVTLRLVF